MDTGRSTDPAAAPTAAEPPVDVAAIWGAQRRLTGRVVRTPLVDLSPDGPAAGLRVKAESLQPTGAFKLRGAYNAILQRLPAARARGVVTHSSGNHARAVAWAARELGLAATVVMPEVAPAVKVAPVRDLGARVVLVPPAERDTRAFAIAAAEGSVVVPPYDDADVVAGQGTVGLEICADEPAVDLVLVPVSGGGLVAGVATAVKALRPSARVVGVEPELAADAAESFRTGRRVSWSAERTYRTIADGLRTTSVGEIPFRQIQRFVDDVVTVTEAEIRSGMRLLAREARLVAEPSGAVAVAGYLVHRDRLPAHRRAVAVLSGGNVAMDLLAEVLGGPPD